MRLDHNIDLGYCTNIHRGESWEETFHGLRTYTNQVRTRVCPESPYGIGLRLSASAAHDLSSDESKRTEFRKWMDETNSYVFTINGFPYGTFHGSRVKEQVYAPDWTTEERLVYTNQLFDLVSELAPAGKSVSVSTLPGSFKEFIRPETKGEQLAAIFANLRSCSRYIDELRDSTGRDIHLGLEPEPLGLFETSGETVHFFDELTSSMENTEAQLLLQNIGVNYDTCHLAIEFEEPENAIRSMQEAGIRISKIHLSSALKLSPNPQSVRELEAFEDEVYLHQVVVQKDGDVVKRIKDLPEAVSWFRDSDEDKGDEWRVHFHVPLHGRPGGAFGDTREHIDGVLAMLQDEPGLCEHFEMETYTWEVMPGEMRTGNVVDQLVAEYEWCLAAFGKHGIRSV